jgi:hypothetical protein
MGLKDLLFRDANPERPSEPISPSAPHSVGNVRTAVNVRPPAAAERPQPTQVSLSSYALTASTDVSDLATRLIEDFKRVVDMNNCPGIDILEFTRALFKKNSNPTADDYRQIFEVLQVVEENLTPQRLIESSAGYKNIVRELAAQDITKGNARKVEVEGVKTAEKQALDTERRTLGEEIARMEAELQRKRERVAQIASSLNGVDQKHQVELDEIAKKLSAIKQAAQQVIGSFDDIENGIRSYLK